MTIFKLTPDNIPTDITDVDTSTTSVIDTDTSITDTTDADTSTNIVLDGPLSQIYTQALNQVYANESAEIDTHIILGGQPDGPADSLYIYCCDGDNMDSTEVMDSMDHLRIALDSKLYRNVVVSIESNGVVNTNMSLLDELSSKLGVSVCYSRSKAMQLAQQFTNGV